jgi:putative spermidine/putrescine transport system ATP-binding protein
VPTAPTDPTYPAAVRCRGVIVRHRGRAVLDGLDFDVAPGSICAVLGASGAGKTTLLRAIAGFDSLSAGTIDVGGVDITMRAPQDRPVTLLFQDPRLFPALSVSENVAFGLRVRGESRENRRKAALELLDEVGLAARADSPIEGLSGGEQQRVALARALCVAPSVLMLDEPFSAVDAPRRNELRQLVVALQQRHAMTVVFVTHDASDALRIADSVAVLVNGTIVQHDDVDTVLQHPLDAVVEALVEHDPVR